MASSTSTTDASGDLGDCVVCGTETTMGCSKCVNAGLTWMYFCSREHQRLIWKTHKLVCGRNPFETPILTKAEAQELWALRRETFDMKGEVTTILENVSLEVRGEPGLNTDEELEAFFRRYLWSLANPNTGQAAVNGSHYLRWLRYQLRLKGTHHPPKLTLERLQTTLIQDPLGFMAEVHAIAEEEMLSSKWYSTFKARVFIFVGTIVAESTGTTAGASQEEETNVYPMIQMLNFGKDCAAGSELEGAQAVLKDWLPHLLLAMGIGDE